MDKRFGLPKTFYWGAATSAHQVEGGNHNNWSKWEQTNAGQLAKEAESKFRHLPGWSDIKEQAQNPQNYISGRACDHYNRFRDDFDMAKSLGHNAHRFSIEWSRVEPEEGKFNEKEIEHYRKVICALRERGMEPFVTLWHWTLPVWLAEKGGILYEHFPDFFERYTKTIAIAFGDDVNFWITVNEPQIIISYGYFKDIWPPQRNSIVDGIRAFRQLIKMHRRAYTALHRVSPRAQVGIATSNSFFEPASQNIADRAVVYLNKYLRNRFFLNQIQDSQDFIGINYYSHDRVSFAYNIKSRGGAFIQNKNKNLWIDDRGHEIYPIGIYHVLKDAVRYGVPLYITENGIADSCDIHRKKSIKEHLYWVNKAIEDGIDVRGYFHWSLLDNFEWDKGFWPRFGLVEVDYKTLERRIRQSAYAYKKIIETKTLK